AYQTRKSEQLEIEEVEAAKFDKFLAQEEVWIRQGVKARRTRNEGRVLRLEQLRRDRAARRDRQGKVELALDAGDKSGKLVAELEHVTKRFGDKTVVRDFSCRLQRGDKIGLIGPNGAGKTTLLRLILGELAADEGLVRLGTKVEVAYFDQFRTQLDEEAALVDVISPGSDFVEIGNEKKHVISYLGDFLFAPQRARSPVKSLSGGERNRLLLARLFARPANVLVLDEPTNDLDIETLELLEELLQEYKGTLFLVSHDRAFIDNVVTQTIASEGDGVWREYAGGYQDWADYQAGRRKDEAAQASAAKRSDARAAEAGKAAAPAGKPKLAAAKLNYKDSRELDALPGKISALEAEQKTLSARLEDPSLYQSESQGAQEAQRCSARLAEIDDELLLLLDRWETLEGTTAD
ncbi:MAG: ATP-binding cassette domain-containing protein, partial [Rhodocyclaceae bacterium]